MHSDLIDNGAFQYDCDEQTEQKESARREGQRRGRRYDLFEYALEIQERKFFL